MRRCAPPVALLAAALQLSACARRPATPPVVLISIDTLRADHLPAYGYRDVQTPNLDAFARDAILYENAYCQTPLTLPSHAVIFTGLPPYRNGVRDNVGFRLSPSASTLAALLKDAGYATGAAVSSFALRAETGLDAGFDLYDDRFSGGSSDERPGLATVETLEKWMGTVDDRPLFLFLHLYEPHTPYAPPEPFRQRYAARPYDGEIAAADAAVGRFVEALNRRGLYDPALVILLSDHGEGLGDHGEDEHGVLLYREAIRVPLLVKLPGARRAGERVARPVSLEDLYPTVASFLRLARRDGLPGSDLLDPGAGKGSARRIYSETLYPRLALGWSDLYSLTDSRYQYIEAPRPELYDLAADPGQRHDLAAGKPEPLRAMRAELSKVPRGSATPERATPEELEKLGSLGYIAVRRGGSGESLPDPKDRLEALRKYKKLFELHYAKEDRRVVELAGEILAEEPRMVSVWRIRARSRERLGDPRGAARDLEAGLANCPDAALEERSQMVEQLAAVLLRAGDRARAERVLRDALSGPLATDSMRLTLARFLSETGRAEEASKILPPASPSEDASVADARGVAAAESGRLEEARRHFEAALAQEPDDATILLHLGMLSLREKNPTRAREWFEKALARQPEAPGTLAALGLAQVQLDDASGAYESWTKATRLDPGQYDALFNLALLSGRLGKAEEARRALERFVATAPPDRYAGQIAQARRLLESMRAGKAG